MTTTVIHPTVPAATALLIDAGSRRPGALRDLMTQYAHQLTASGTLAALTPEDARVVAILTAWEVLHGDEGRGLRDKAWALLHGEWRWTPNHVEVATALYAAADTLDRL